MYQFVCYGNRLHLFFQTLSCFCSAYNKHPELSSSWLFYLPPFFKPELLQPSRPWGCHWRVLGLGPHNPFGGGGKPKDRPSWERQNPRVLRNGGAGWGPVAGLAEPRASTSGTGSASGAELCSSLGPHSTGRRTWWIFLQLWAVLGSSCLHPASVGSDLWTHLPSQSTPQALQALAWSWTLPWAMVGWACPYLGSSRKDSNVSPKIQEHPSKAQNFTGAPQPCDKVPRTKKSQVSATAELAGEPQSTNSTIIYCTGCAKLNTWATEHDTIISSSVQPQNQGMIPSDKHIGRRAWHCSCRWALFISLNQYHNIQANNFLIYFPEFPCPQYLSPWQHKERREGYRVEGWVWERGPPPGVCEWLALEFSAYWLTG